VVFGYAANSMCKIQLYYLIQKGASIWGDNGSGHTVESRMGAVA